MFPGKRSTGEMERTCPFTQQHPFLCTTHQTHRQNLWAPSSQQSQPHFAPPLLSASSNPPSSLASFFSCLPPVLLASTLSLLQSCYPKGSQNVPSKAPDDSPHHSEFKWKLFPRLIRPSPELRPPHSLYHPSVGIITPARM